MKKIIFGLLLFSALPSIAALPPVIYEVNSNCPSDAPYQVASGYEGGYESRYVIRKNRCVSCDTPVNLPMSQAACLKCPNRESIKNPYKTIPDCRLKQCPADSPIKARDGCFACDHEPVTYAENSKECMKCPHRRWVDVVNICVPDDNDAIYFKDWCSYTPVPTYSSSIPPGGHWAPPKISCSQLTSELGVITSPEECARCSNTYMSNGCCAIQSAGNIPNAEPTPAPKTLETPELKNINRLDDLQIFKDTDGLVKKIKSPEEYPTAKEALEKINQSFIPFPENNCSQQLDNCLQGIDRYNKKQRNECYQKGETCHQDYQKQFDLMQQKLTNKVILQAEWIMKFFQMNRKLGEPFTGDLWIKNSEGKDELYFYQDGVSKQKYDFSIQDIEDTQLTFYQKLDANDQKRLYLLKFNTPYSGIILKEKLPQKEFCITHYLAQDYKDGFAVNDPYEFTIAFCNEENLRAKVSTTLTNWQEQKFQFRNPKME